MLITKTNPQGIDFMLQQLQTMLHDSLLLKWGISSADYKCYGRCYRNRYQYGYVAENYEGGREYKEVYWDDALKVLSFFGTSQRVIFEGSEKADVHLVFFVNLEKIKPSVVHRADEEVRKDVIELLRVSNYGLSYEGYEVYVENVLREYPGSRRDDRLTAVDMHPTHCFRINLSSIYDITKNNCQPFTNI
jgi:hypothetical protein